MLRAHRRSADGLGHALTRAVRPLVEQLENRILLAINFNSPVWIEQGPGPSINGAASAAPDNQVVGAIQAIATPPNDASVVFVGTVNGGIWLSRDANVAPPASPNWILLTGPDLAGPTIRPRAVEQPSQSIGAIALSHFDSTGTKITKDTPPLIITKLVIYAGFARLSSGAQDGGPLAGLIKSTDGGTNWKPIGESTNVSFKNQNIIAIVPAENDPNTVLVATVSRDGRSGIYRSTDGGTRFEKVLDGPVTDLVSDPGNPNRYYAGVILPGTKKRPAQTGIYRNNEGGAKGKWVKVNTGLDVIKNNGVDDDHDGKKDNGEEVANARRVQLAVAPTGSGDDRAVFAALISFTTNRTMGVYRSTNHGDSWQLLNNLPNIHPSTQGATHFSMVADSATSNRVFVAGDNDEAPGNAGNIFRGEIGNDGNTTWIPVFGGHAGNTFPHPDSRDMVFDKDGNILQADDGGIYRLINPNLDTRRWQSRSGNIRAAEFFAVAFDPLNKSIFGGLQDNGQTEQPSIAKGGGIRWAEQRQGDGTAVQIDTSLPGFTYHYSSNQNLRSLNFRKYDATGNLLKTTFANLLIQNVPASLGLTLTGSSATGFLKGVFDNTLPYVSQFALNATDNRATNPSNLRMLIGSDYLYEVFFSGEDTDHKVVSLGGLRKKGTKFGPDKSVGTVTAMAYGGKLGATPAPDIAYVAAGNKLLVRKAISKTDSAGRPVGDLKQNSLNDFLEVDNPARFIRDIVLDPADWQKGFIVDASGDVWGFVNAANSIVDDWKIHTGRLNSLTRDIRTVEYIPGPKPILLVGGQGGVFATTDLSGSDSAVWVRVGQRMPNVVVRDLRYDPTTDTLIAGTFGRGAWKIDSFKTKVVSLTASPVDNPDAPKLSLVAGDPGVLEITGDEAANKNDTFRLVLNPTNPQLLDVFINNTSEEPDFIVETSAVQKVIITAGDGTDTLIIDHANGSVRFPEPIDFDGEDRQEINLTPIGDGIVSKIRAGLDALATWSANLAQLAELTQNLPGLGTGLAQTLAVGDGSPPIAGALRQGLIDKINDYFDLTQSANKTPTVQELLDVLRSLARPLGKIHFNTDPLSVTGGLFTDSLGQQELRFDLALRLDGFEASLPVDFNTTLESFGVKLSSTGRIDLTTALKLDFSFGVNLAPGLSDTEAFFLRLRDLSAEARITAGVQPVKAPLLNDIRDYETGTPLNFDLQLGFLKGQIEDGSLKLNAALRLNVLNPDDDVEQRITLSELTGTSISSLLDIEVEGNLAVDLPVNVSLAGLFSENAQPSIKITSDDLFDLSALTVTADGFEDLFNFSNISAASVVLGLRQLAEALGSFGKSSAFGVPIPLTSRTLGDALNFASTATLKLTDPLVDPMTNQPNFSTADELADRLAVALGLDPAIVNVTYDPATNELTYRVSFSQTYNPASAGIDLGLDLSPVGELSFASDFILNATAGADFIFGINLGELAPDQSLADRFFIQDATLSGSASLSATNLLAQAKIGFLGVGVAGGSGSLEATATIELQNPSASAPAPLAAADMMLPASRISLPSFVSLLVSNPLSLIAPPRVTDLMPGVSVNISQMPGNQVEPVIVIDPTNTQRLFAVSNDPKAGSMTASYSTDGGATWISRKIATGPEMGGGDGFEFACCDPAAAFDRFGNLYFAYLNNNHDRVTILLSRDAGQTFEPIPVGEFSATRLDRPVLTSGPGDSPGSASVWLAYLNVDSGIQVASLRVTGADRADIGPFSLPRLLTGTSLDNFADISVGPKGQVMVVVQSANAAMPNGPSNINVMLDPDGLGPQNFGTKQLVSQTGVGPKDAIPAQPTRKITAAPSVAYALAGPHVGTAYVVYTQESPDESNDTDIVLRYSTKDGAVGSWSAPIAVGHAPKGSSQFFPSLAVDPKTGHIAVAWYDTRDDTNNKKAAFLVALSTDGGRSFVETQVSLGTSDEANANNDPDNPQPDDGNDLDFGDYTGLDFFDGNIYPAWADNSSGGRFDIFTAKVTLGKTSMPAPAPSATISLVTPLTTSGIIFTGSAHLELPIAILPAGFIPLNDAKITIDWPDLTDISTLDVQFANVTDAIESLFDSFDNLTFDDILAALQAVVNHLKDLKGFGFLNKKLPLLDVSVSGLLDYAQEFSDKLDALRANPAGSLQALNDAMTSAFGVPVMFSLDPSNNLKVQFDFLSHFAGTRNLNFDLASLLATGNFPNLAGIVNISGSAALDVAVDASLNLALGIDLSDPLNPAPFLYDGPTGTRFSLDASLNATIPNVNVSIGILSASIVNGTASIHRGTDPSKPARFAVNLADDNADGRHYFSENLIEDVNIDLDAAAQIELPLHISFPTPQTLTPNLKITIADLAKLFNGDAGSVDIQAPDLSTLIGDLDLLNNLSGLIEGLDQLLALLQNTLDSKAFSRNLPLVGTRLKDGAQVIKTFRTDLLAQLKPLFDIDNSVNGARDALFKVLGPVSAGNPNALNVLVDSNNDAMVTIDDIAVVMDDPNNPSDVRFDFRVRKTPVVSTFKPDLDIGLSALQLQTTGKVDVEMGFDFRVGIGLNRAIGAYFDTSAVDELMLDFGIGISTLAATGRLGFLQLNISAMNPTRFQGVFAVDLLDSATDADDKLTINELTDAAVSAHLTADANINLALVVSFGDAARFPSVLSDLHIDWHFDSDTSASSFGNAPNVAFENIRLNLGSFISKFAAPVFGQIQSVLRPLQPVVDLLNTRVEMLEAVSSIRNFFDTNGDKKVFVSEVIQTLDPSPVLDFIHAVGAFNNLVSAANTLAGSSILINLGRFDLNNVPDLRGLSNLQGVTLTNFSEANVNAQLQSQTPGFASALNDPTLGSATGAGGGKLEIPLLQSPAKIFKLLLGQDVDLFLWDMPAMDLNLEIHKSFPILGPISAFFGGSVSLHVDLGFGYDTFGLRKFKATGNESDVFEGFFLIDKPAGATFDPPEISAQGKITIGAGVDVLVASASVRGSIVGTLDLNLNNPDNDPEGKVRFTELAQNFNKGLLCIFDITGKLEAVLSIHASVGVWPFKKSFNHDAPPIELLSFEHSCDDVPQADPILATDIGGGVLRLNMGPNAHHRLTVNTADGDEHFVVDADPAMAGNVRVSAFGFTQSFADIDSIFADAGFGNDMILIDPALDVTALLVGGAGDDTISAGAGSATIVGDDVGNLFSGNDLLTGGSSKDIIRGLGGNDTINGRGGDDSIIGGDGDDLLYGEDGGDTLVGGVGNDSLIGGDGKDSLNGGDGHDTLEGQAGNDTLLGGSGNDLFQGGEGDDSILGGDGQDSLAGDEGNDTLDGQAGPDLLFGGDDNDKLIGGTHNDTLHGQAGNDSILGGDGQDQLFGGQGNDTLAGEADNDDLFGDAGNDSLDGGEGNDLLSGGADHDVIFGRAGRDFIDAGAGNDKLEGGDDDDTIVGGADDDTILGGLGNDSIEGGSGNDSIEGGAGADTVHGQEGHDFIAGQEDPDRLFGDTGNDTIAGGAGADYIEGGADDDLITGGDHADRIFGNPGADILFGDNGVVIPADGSANSSDIISTDPTIGGKDTISGGTEDDTIIGGSGGDDSSDCQTGGGDSLSGDAGDDIVIGDNAHIQRNDNLVVEQIRTIFPGQGGNDALFGHDGNDTMLGGFGADQIDGAADHNIMLGDNGRLDYTVSDSSSQLMLITATDPTLGCSDTILAGAGNDTIMGGTASESIRGGGGNDLIFGDHGQIDFSLPANANFLSIHTAGADGGARDVIHGEAGNDTILGGQGADELRGGEGDDDLIGGHNAPGSDAADSIDGGVGNDAIAGDNASIIRRADSVSPRFRALTGTVLYDTSGVAAVTGSSQSDPAGAVGRDISLIAHSGTTPADQYGNDSLAGGADNDLIFGGLGNDTVQGDGSVDLLVGAATPSVLAPSDGDDYIEGNGGDDLLFGNGGQDDIVGGSSSLFGLINPDLRPDGSDLIFGGAGDRIARNHAGDTSADGHAADADSIVGDNGNLIRVVGTNGASSGGFLVFNYDNYGAQKIIPRAVDLLDYTPATGSPADNGGADTIHGEAGDDAIYGQLGDDVLFGDAQDDNLFGGAGNDRMYGGSGEDGMLGDDGMILTSRNGLTEPLHGITSPNPLTQIALPGKTTGAWIFITGRINKTVDLTPFDMGGNDLMFGGLGDDFIHGGAGDDAISGAEAQAQFYNAKPVGASFFDGLFSVADPTNPLGYDPATTKFAAYDNSTPNSPMRKINGFFLNFDAVDAMGAKINDGKDRLFGDGGNDWLVGGTMNDRAFGGSGDDVINSDDNLDTNGGLNNRPDDALFADRDFAFGGTGRDALIGNTGGDRMFDWFGEYNSFFVPFSVFAEPTIVRLPGPDLTAFLLALGRESGADQTLSEPDGELGLSEAGERGQPRDPQPGNVPGVRRDTTGAPEDDRGTALPLSAPLLFVHNAENPPQASSTSNKKSSKSDLLQSQSQLLA